MQEAVILPLPVGPCALQGDAGVDPTGGTLLRMELGGDRESRREETWEQCHTGIALSIMRCLGNGGSPEP